MQWDLYSTVQCSTVCVVVKTTLNNIAMKHIEATILLLRFCRGLARFLRFSRSRWCSEKTQPTLASSSYYVPTLPSTYLLYSVVIYRTVNVSMKVEHDLLCNECLSPAGTVAAAATQPRPTDRAGGCCLNFYCLGLSRNVQLCYCLSNSQISPHC